MYDSIGVLGGGSWGTTLAHLLGTNGHNTLLWLRDDEALSAINQNHRNPKYTGEFVLSKNIQATNDLQQVAQRCEIIVAALPSHCFRSVTYHLGDFIKADQILLSACKGIEGKTYSRMSTILREETCCLKIGVLAGPNLHEEILKGHPSATVVASPFHEVITKTLQAFVSTNFKVYGNDDMVGAELGGAIKNVIAIAAGMLDGLGYGDNVKALLITRGITEMSRIGLKLGAKPLTFTGLTGVGDTMVTCTSRLSRNYQVGYHLAKGKSLEEILSTIVSVAEGINTSRALLEFAQANRIEIPIIEGVYRVLYENKSIMEVIFESMQRKVHWEIDPTFS